MGLTSLIKWIWLKSVNTMRLIHLMSGCVFCVIGVFSDPIVLMRRRHQMWFAYSPNYWRNMCSIGRKSREHIKDQSRAISVCNYRIYLWITSPLCKCVHCGLILEKGKTWNFYFTKCTFFISHKNGFGAITDLWIFCVKFFSREQFFWFNHSD